MFPTPGLIVRLAHLATAAGDSGRMHASGCCVRKMGQRSMTPRLAQTLAKATGLAASAGAAVSIAWWLDPAFADATGVAVMLVGFVFTLAGLVLVLRASRGRGPEFAGEL